MEKPQRRNENEIEFLMCSDPGRVQDKEVVNKVIISDRRLVRAKITLNLKRTRTKLITRKQANLDGVRAKAEEFRIALKNKYEALVQEDSDDVEKMNEDITNLLPKQRSK